MVSYILPPNYYGTYDIKEGYKFACIKIKLIQVHFFNNINRQKND